MNGKQQDLASVACGKTQQSLSSCLLRSKLSGGPLTSQLRDRRIRSGIASSEWFAGSKNLTKLTQPDLGHGLSMTYLDHQASNSRARF